MVKLTVEEQVEYPVLPPDSILFLKVESVTTKTVNEGTSNAWQKCEFKFKILGIQHTGDGSPVQAYDLLIGQNIFGSVPARITNHPENKLRMWAEAILGMDLGIGFDLDTDDLERRQVRGITSTYNKRNSSAVRHQVESLLRMGNEQPPPLPAHPHQVAQEQQMFGQPQQGFAQQQQPFQQQPQFAQQGAAQGPPQGAPAQGDPWAGQPSSGWEQPPF